MSAALVDVVLIGSRPRGTGIGPMARGLARRRPTGWQTGSRWRRSRPLSAIPNPADHIGSE
ncbi:MAG: hypothetical protein AVDCRST_MAG49-2689 [uncultured Thermomicrobiales bacterium]|uniref:Uncharacterized protein n=1 Tax=uncultured Thermomicrobiales bacterium TaxID=1645740 RepID=A0A6J4UYC3_9BACT|nr:MAG: hypothetical protein AVDCRST_MAG49-2689 [uncultured Thermomicrobiales bacterium]